MYCYKDDFISNCKVTYKREKSKKKNCFLFQSIQMIQLFDTTKRPGLKPDLFYSLDWNCFQPVLSQLIIG